MKMKITNTTRLTLRLRMYLKDRVTEDVDVGVELLKPMHSCEVPYVADAVNIEEQEEKK